MKIFQTLFILLFSGVLYAQNFVDLANIYWRTSPSNSIEGSADKVDFNTWAMDAKVPVVLSDKLTLLPGFELTNNRISNSTDNWIFSSTTLQLGAEMNLKSASLFTKKAVKLYFD